jgi:predicted metal-binding membrane protein
MPHLLRSTMWLGFFGLILASWWFLFSMSTSMGVDLLGRPGETAARMAAMDPQMAAGMPMAQFGTLFGMWAVMMAAMMLPTLIPTLSSYEALTVSANGTRGGWLGVLAGYFMVWVGFAALIAAAQLVLLHGGVIDMLGIAKTNLFSGLLLIAVGAFQFTRAKEFCHGFCHSPMIYFLSFWQTGPTGGVRMGLGLGAFCVGCCWGFMALGFVGGVMNLTWMGLATLFMVLEKLPQIGHVLMKPMGAILIVAGLAVLAVPFIIGGY